MQSAARPHDVFMRPPRQELALCDTPHACTSIDIVCCLLMLLLGFKGNQICEPSAMR
jgi:hypothetical protein